MPARRQLLREWSQGRVAHIPKAIWQSQKEHLVFLLHGHSSSPTPYIRPSEPLESIQMWLSAAPGEREAAAHKEEFAFLPVFYH